MKQQKFSRIYMKNGSNNSNYNEKHKSPISSQEKDISLQEMRKHNKITNAAKRRASDGGVTMSGKGIPKKLQMKRDSDIQDKTLDEYMKKYNYGDSRNQKGNA